MKYFQADIGKEEIDEVVDTIKSGWLTTGPKTKQFEDEFKEYIGCKHAIAVNSCTAALHLSLVALGIGPGDEVITTPNTFISTINVILHVGATPVLVDVDPISLNIDPYEIEKAITPKTKAILPVHYAGRACHMNAIMEIADKYNLKVIEDAAHGVSSEWKGTKIGNFGDTTCFSFYVTKNMTTGEGGMITTDNDRLAKRLRILRLHGIDKDIYNRDSWYYEVVCPGYKCNMTDIQASIGIHQLRKIDKMQKRREEIAKKYYDAFMEIQGVQTQPLCCHCKHSWYIFPILVDNRDEFTRKLDEKGIPYSVHFIPVYKHPMFKVSNIRVRGRLEESKYIYNHILSLPIYPLMTDKEVNEVIEAVKWSVS